MLIIRFVCIFIYFLNKGLINVYIKRDIKHKNDRPHGFVNNNVGIILSLLYSLSVQVVGVILS